MKHFIIDAEPITPLDVIKMTDALRWKSFRMYMSCAHCGRLLGWKWRFIGRDIHENYHWLDKLKQYRCPCKVTVTEQ